MYVSMSNNARKRLIFNNMEVAMVISQLFLSFRKCARKNSFRLIFQIKKSYICCRNKLYFLNKRTLVIIYIHLEIKIYFCVIKTRK